MALPVPATDTASTWEHIFRNGTDHPACDPSKAISHTYAITQRSPHGYSQSIFSAYANAQSHADAG